MHRDRQLGAGLDLPHRQDAVADMLAAHADYVGSALAGIEQERKSESGLAADRMPLLELGNFGIGPAVKSVRVHPDAFNVTGRIVFPHVLLDSMPHQDTQD